MTILTITAAAQTAGIDRRTLQRAVKVGRISATVDASGRRGVDVAELLRVFGPLPGTPQHVALRPRATAPQETAGAFVPAALADALQNQVRQLETQLQKAEERESRLMAMLEMEQQTRTALEQKLLPAPKKKGKGK